MPWKTLRACSNLSQLCSLPDLSLPDKIVAEVLPGEANKCFDHGAMMSAWEIDTRARKAWRFTSRSHRI